MAISDETPAPPGQQRGSPRFRYFGSIFLSWIGPSGKNAVMGKCFDISASGLGVEVASRISAGTKVTVRAEWANLNGLAMVRHATQKAGAFHLGLELSKPFSPEMLAKLIAPNSRIG